MILAAGEWQGRPEESSCLEFCLSLLFEEGCDCTPRCMPVPDSIIQTPLTHMTLLFTPHYLQLKTGHAAAVTHADTVNRKHIFGYFFFHLGLFFVLYEIMPSNRCFQLFPLKKSNKNYK